MAVIVPDAIGRLETELWGPSQIVTEKPDGAGWEPHAVVSRSGALVLLPLQRAAVTAGAALRWTDSASATTVVSQLAAWVGLRSGLAKPLLRNRIWIRTGQSGSLHELLATRLDVDEVHLACAFGPPRPNQKPVIRVLDGGGTTVGFAKVGWNDLTTRLVTHEAAFLQSRDATRHRRVRIPRVVAVESWNDRTVAVLTTALGSVNWRRRRPSIDTLREVVGMAPNYTTSLADSPYRARLDGQVAPDDARLCEALGAVDARWAGTRLEFGRWHGDWAPWNMSATGTMLVVWDWERTAPDTPVGLDSIHYEFQRRVAREDHAPAAALRDAVAAATPQLEALGVPAEDIPMLACLYAIEMSVRFQWAGTEPPSQVGWLDGLLEATVRHFAA